MDIWNVRVTKSSHKIELDNMTRLCKTFKFHFVLLLSFYFRVTFTYLALINYSVWKTYYFLSNIDSPNLILDWSHWNFLISFFRQINFANPKWVKDFKFVSVCMVFIFFSKTRNWCRPLKQEWNDENCTTTGYPWKAPIKEFVFL